MYKDKEKQKEATRIASKRYRNKQKGMTKGMTEEGMTEEGITPRVLHLAEGLIDPEKRAKLIKISESLDKSTAGLGGKVNLNTLVRYGIGGFLFSEIKELL